MTATNPAYYQSGVSCQHIRQKEHRFQLYMNQHDVNSIGVGSGEKNPPFFGAIVIDDWTIRDGPAVTANVVARARGMHISDGKGDDNWLFCHSILFTDSRFKGSSLKVNGDFVSEEDGEWAIVGGTGEFAYAQGVVTAKITERLNPTTGRIWELRIHVSCLCISEMTKMGPWGGEGGIAFDIPKAPLSLQSVTIGHGDVINSLAFSYTDEDGNKKTAGPWGGDGALITTITLAPSETMKQVVGTTATVGGTTVVTSLTLISIVWWT